jgi:hypothetical protein
MRALFLAVILSAAGSASAHAWWQYAEWGMTESQLASASGGRLAPCRADAPACARPAGGVTPTRLVEGITMIGMPASTSFAFDAGDKLNQTVVYFPGGDMGLLVSLLRGIHGTPVDEQATPKVWRDTRRGTELTALPAAQGVILFYRPIAAR